MLYLEQSQSATMRIGPFLDETDGKTAEVALAIAQADIRLSKAGGDFAQVNHAQGGGNIVHDEFGWYILDLNATDTNTLGSLEIAIHEGGALPVWKEFTILAANVYDSLVGGGDNLDVALGNIAHGGAAATLTLLSAGITNGAGPALALSGTTAGLDIDASAGPGIAIDGTTFAVEADASAGPGVHIGGTNHGMEIDASAGPGVQIDGTTFAIEATASAGPGVYVEGTAYGLQVAGTGGPGVDITGGVGAGVAVDGVAFGIEVDATAGPAVHLGGTTHGLEIAASAGPGVEIDGTTFAIEADASGGPGVHIGGTTIGLDVDASGGPGVDIDGTTGGMQVNASNGDALVATSTGGGGDGIQATGNGAGFDINADIQGTVSGTPTTAENADAVWDEVITAVAHGAADSGAYYLRRLHQTLVSRVQQCGGVGGATTIELDAGASAVNDFYKGQLIVITAAVGAGQARACTAYDGVTKIATVGPAWATNPTAASWFAILNVGAGVISAIDDGAITAAAIAPNAIGASELAADAVTEIATGVYAHVGLTAGGVVDAGTMLAAIYSMARGKIVKAGNVYQFMDDDDVTVLFTLTIAAGARTTA